VGAPDGDWEWDDDRVLRTEPADRYLRLHVEAGMALKIALATGEFRPGRYTRTNARSNDWKLH
jgi:hypothetical protein